MHTRLLVVSLALLNAAAQDSSSPPKTGSVTGIAIDDKTGEPIARAVIILRHDRDDGVGGVADAKGKFTLREIDPGTYTLSVEREGYVAARRQPQTVIVQAGQDTSDVKVKLLRTGALSGRILDPEGDPVSGVSVLVTLARARKNAPAAPLFATSNDRGEYRIFHIPPAAYKVSATFSAGNRHNGVRMQRPAPNGSAPAGEAYPPVYYPATTDARQAAVVTVEPGADLHGIDLQLVRTRGVRVRGRVLPSAAGAAPLFQFLTLVPAGLNFAPAGLDFVMRDPKGEFEFTDVLPGRYRLQLQTAGPNDSHPTSVQRTLDVGDSDIEGIEIAAAQAPVTLNGRLAAPVGRKLPPGLIVVLQPREAGDTQSGAMAQVDAEGAFTMPGVAPGDYDALVGATSGEGDDSYIQAIRMGTVDALAEGIHVGEGPPAPLEIVLKANGGAADCTVTSEQGEPVPGAMVVAAPDKPRDRQLALLGQCQTKADGTCKIGGITPGEYHVYAFAAGTEIDPRDPDTLKPFEKYAEAARFAEGDRKTISLKVAPVE